MRRDSVPGSDGVRRGVLALAAGEATTRLLGFALSAVIARRAGLDALAALTVAQGLIAYALVAGDAGLSTDAVRRLAAGDGSRSHLIALTTAAQICLTAAATTVLLIVVAVLPLTTASKQPVLALSLLPLSYALNLGYVLQSSSRFKALTISRITGQVAGVVLGVACLVRFDSFLLAVASIVLGAFVTDLLIAVASRQDWMPVRQVTVRAVLVRIKQGRGFLGYTMANHASSSSPLLVIAIIGTAPDVAHYSVAQRILLLAMAPAQILAAVLLPRISLRGHVLDDEYWSQVLSVSVVAAGAASALFVFARPISEALFGPAAASAAPVVRLVAIFLPVGYTSLLLTTTLLSRGRASMQAAITAGSLLPLLVLAATFIRSSGAEGPLYAVLLTEVLVIVAVSRALRVPPACLVRLALVLVVLFGAVAASVHGVGTLTNSLGILALVWLATAAPAVVLGLRAFGGRPLAALTVSSRR